MNRGMSSLCSVRRAIAYFACGLLIFSIIHLINSGIMLSYRRDVDAFGPLAWNSTKLPKPSTNNVDIRQYALTLSRFESIDHWIVLSLIDQGCADMAINLYLTSLRPFNIQNYLFIGQDQGTCDIVEPYGINCYVYVTDQAAVQSSLYLSKDFLRKMNIRTYMILDALNLGYNVLHTDVDMTFLKNPFEDFVFDENFDVAPLWDCGAYNAGFLFIRNTKASRGMYAVMKHIADTEPKTDDQQALNRGIKKAKKQHGLQLRQLSKKKYLCGSAYWEDGKRDFADDKPCKECVVIHDNWIVSMEAKRYRLQESGFWDYDGPHKYYTCPERRYLVYSNPEFVGNAAGTEALEMEALKAALAIGTLLNRTVILPRFHCGQNGERECNLLHHLLVRNLETQFKGLYRESAFLKHPLVPADLTTSVSRVYFIDSDKANEINNNPETLLDVAFFRPLDKQKGATPTEILEWFHSNKARVLQFHSLYGAVCCFNDYRFGPEFEEKIKNAFSKKGNYRQFDR